MSTPKHLPDDVRAVYEELYALGASGPEFEAYCGQVARLRDAQKRISEEGLVVADEKGRPVPHPALAIERAAQAEVRAWAGRFGLKPSRPTRASGF